MEQDANTNSQPFYKRMKKSSLITMIVSLSVIGVLILTTIILAIAPTYTGVNFENKPDRIEIIIDSNLLTLYADEESTKEDYNKVLNAYNASSSASVMDALLNGYAGRGKTACYSESSKSYGNLSTETTFSVTFYWDEAQEMTNGNGSTYYYTTSTGSQATTATNYDAATFAVSNESKVEEKTIFLRKTGITNLSSTHYYYTGVANFYELYKVLNDLQDDGKFSPYQ